jgi:hypothetical protein
LLHVYFADEGKGFAEFRRGDALEIMKRVAAVYMLGCACVVLWACCALLLFVADEGKGFAVFRREHGLDTVN